MYRVLSRVIIVVFCLGGPLITALGCIYGHTEPLTVDPTRTAVIMGILMLMSFAFGHLSGVWLYADPKTIEPTRNWEEDFDLENGNYRCECYKCREPFLGHKRRVLCKRCNDEVVRRNSTGAI